jgi:protein-arginine kinase activator protein McsA
MEQQFKAGDTVRLKYFPRTKVFILETQLQTCYADVQQVWYTGRVFSTGRFREGVGKVERFSAIEVEAIPPMSAELTSLIEEKEMVKLQKEEAIKAQDFEKAAKLRNQERELKSKIEMLDMDSE